MRRWADDLTRFQVSLLLVERLASLQRTRPYAVAHMLPQDMTHKTLLGLLPHHILRTIGAAAALDILPVNTQMPADLQTLWEMEDGVECDVPPVMAQRSGRAASSMNVSACSLEALRIPSLSAGMAWPGVGGPLMG